MKPIVLSALLFAATSMHALAQVSVADPWVRATVSQQKTSGAFMSITSVQGGRLVEAKSPVAGTVEIHEMKMENNIMKMRAVAGIELPPGKPVALAPSGYHVMLMDLKKQMKEGDAVPLTLIVEGRDKKREAVEVKAIVRSLTGTTKKSGHDGH